MNMWKVYKAGSVLPSGRYLIAYKNNDKSSYLIDEVYYFNENDVVYDELIGYKRMKSTELPNGRQLISKVLGYVNHVIIQKNGFYQLTFIEDRQTFLRAELYEDEDALIMPFPIYINDVKVDDPYIISLCSMR